MKNLIRTVALAVLTASLAAIPPSLQAQSTNKAPAGKKQTAGPFHGKLAALDKSANTISVGKRTFHVTADTKLLKAGKAATLADGVVGEEVSGGFKTAEDGKLVATKVTFGPKVDGKSGAKKK